LRGHFTSHHAFLLRQMLTQLEFRRISKHRGPKRAGIAVAHNILVIAYHMLRNGSGLSTISEPTTLTG
jgi:hypothetical protein